MFILLLFFAFAFLVVFLSFYFALFLSLPKRLPFNPTGKHCLITGGSKGIGKAIGAKLLGEGCRSLSLFARGRETLAMAKQELELLCGPEQSVHTFQLDITENHSKIEEVIRKAEALSGPVDLLVNNAGTCLQGSFDALPADAFESQMRTNYLGAVYATRAVVDGMKNRRSGHIAFVCSAAGQLAIWGYSAYSPSKFAVRGLADVLHMELLPFDVGTTILFPPNTSTEGFQEEQRTMPPQKYSIFLPFSLSQEKKMEEKRRKKGSKEYIRMKEYLFFEGKGSKGCQSARECPTYSDEFPRRCCMTQCGYNVCMTKFGDDGWIIA